MLCKGPPWGFLMNSQTFVSEIRSMKKLSSKANLAEQGRRDGRAQGTGSGVRGWDVTGQKPHS